MKKIALICFSFVFVAMFSAGANAQTCGLDRSGDKDVPNSGGFTTVEKGDYKKVAGTVSGADKAGIAGAHIALFRVENGTETFIGSQKADDKGKFCLDGMPEGKYVLRAGASGKKGVEFKFNYNVSREWASQSKIKLELQ